MKLHVLVAALVLLAATARCETLKVPQQHETIQAAVDASAEGDVILVSKGTYTSFTISGKPGRTVRGKSKVVIDGAGSGLPIINVENSPGTVLSKLTVTGGTGFAINLDDLSEGSTISKCKVDGGSVGVAIGGTDMLVEKCRFENITGFGVSMLNGSTDIALEKNRLEATEGGFEVFGSGHRILKNRIEASTSDGIYLEASTCTIEKNTLDGLSANGIDVMGDDNVIVKNKIRNADENGIEVEQELKALEVTGNTFEKNIVTASDGHGFFVAAGGNTFTKNKTKQSGLFGLHDEAGDGANTYEKNNFDSEELVEPTN